MEPLRVKRSVQLPDVDGRPGYRLDAENGTVSIHQARFTFNAPTVSLEALERAVSELRGARVP